MAEVDGALAGAFFIVEREWRVGERLCRATDGVDNAVDIAYRSQGIFSAMSEHFSRHLRDDFECSIGNYPVNPAVRRLRSRLAAPCGPGGGEAAARHAGR